MNLIKNAFVYAADLPAISELEANLKKLPYHPIGQTQWVRYSFVTNAVTNELVTPIAGGYTFSFRCDEKILPASVVQAMLDERIEKIEQEEDRKLSRKERSQVKEEIVLELLPTALVKQTITHAFFDTQHRLLVLATSGSGVADSLIGALLEVSGGFKSRKLTIADLDIRLTNRLMVHISGSDKEGFTPFGLGEYLQLKDRDGNKTTFETDQYPKKGIQEAVQSGCQVERIDLYQPQIVFRLTRKFDFKSIRFADADTENDIDPAQDAAGYWRHEAGVQLALLSNAVLDLGALFEASMAVEIDKAETATEDDEDSVDVE